MAIEDVSKARIDELVLGLVHRQGLGATLMG
jgi:hypothetical protein